jgi:hypothetical protein
MSYDAQGSPKKWNLVLWHWNTLFEESQEAVLGTTEFKPIMMRNENHKSVTFWTKFEQSLTSFYQNVGSL